MKKNKKEGPTYTLKIVSNDDQWYLELWLASFYWLFSYWVVAWYVTEKYLKYTENRYEASYEDGCKELTRLDRFRQTKKLKLT